MINTFRFLVSAALWLCAVGVGLAAIATFFLIPSPLLAVVAFGFIGVLALALGGIAAWAAPHPKRPS